MRLINSGHCTPRNSRAAATTNNTTMEEDDDVNKVFESVEADMGGKPVDFSKFEAVAVLPGDDITAYVSKFSKQIRIGNGIVQRADHSVISTLSGTLKFKKPNKFFVSHRDHRYIPCAEELVIGTVIERQSECYKVDIGTTCLALLPILEFNGASKRNHPNLAINSLVYAKVVSANKDMPAELTCKASVGPSKDWVTGESIYGELKGGYIFNCSLNLSQQLLRSSSCFVLNYLGKYIPYEIAIGMNGRVWVNAKTASHTVLISNAIKSSETLDEAAITSMINKMLNITLTSEAAADDRMDLDDENNPASE